MKVKLNTIYADEKMTATIGDVIIIDDKKGKELIKGGYAVLFSVKPPIVKTKPEEDSNFETPIIETAEMPEPETAETPTTNKPRGRTKSK